MADFVGLLKKTIEAQPQATSRLRERIYERARATVKRKLIENKASDETIVFQQSVLQQAIDEVEAYYRAREREAIASHSLKTDPLAQGQVDTSTQEVPADEQPQESSLENKSTEGSLLEDAGEQEAPHIVASYQSSSERVPHSGDEGGNDPIISAQASNQTDDAEGESNNIKGESVDFVPFDANAFRRVERIEEPVVLSQFSPFEEQQFGDESPLEENASESPAGDVQQELGESEESSNWMESAQPDLVQSKIETATEVQHEIPSLASFLGGDQEKISEEDAGEHNGSHDFLEHDKGDVEEDHNNAREINQGDILSDSSGGDASIDHVSNSHAVDGVDEKNDASSELKSAHPEEGLLQDVPIWPAEEPTRSEDLVQQGLMREELPVQADFSADFLSKTEVPVVEEAPVAGVVDAPAFLAQISVPSVLKQPRLPERLEMSSDISTVSVLQDTPDNMMQTSCQHTEEATPQTESGLIGGLGDVFPLPSPGERASISHLDRDMFAGSAAKIALPEVPFADLPPDISARSHRDDRSFAATPSSPALPLSPAAPLSSVQPVMPHETTAAISWSPSPLVNSSAKEELQNDNAVEEMAPLVALSQQDFSADFRMDERGKDLSSPFLDAAGFPSQIKERQSMQSLSSSAAERMPGMGIAESKMTHASKDSPFPISFKGDEMMGDPMAEGNFGAVSDIFSAVVAKREKDKKNIRRLIVTLLVSIILIALAGFFWFFMDDYWNKDRQAAVDEQTTVTSVKKEETPAAESTPKMTQRLLPGGHESDPGPTTDEVQIGGGTGSFAENVPIEREARVVYIEAADPTAPVMTNEGRVTWSLSRTPSEFGGLDELGIVGTIEIPDRDMTVRLSIQRNNDVTIDAAYLFYFTFVTSQNLNGEDIDAIRLLFKASEQSEGQALVGAIPVKVRDNFFVLALRGSRQALEHNLALIRQLPFLRLNIIYANSEQEDAFLEEDGVAQEESDFAQDGRGNSNVDSKKQNFRIGEFSIEKGAHGDNVFKQAVDDWLVKANWAPLPGKPSPATPPSTANNVQQDADIQADPVAGDAGDDVQRGDN